jgi:hypothetical protein
LAGRFAVLLQLLVVGVVLAFEEVVDATGGHVFRTVICSAMGPGLQAPKQKPTIVRFMCRKKYTKLRHQLNASETRTDHSPSAAHHL